MVELTKVSDKQYGYVNCLVFGTAGAGKTHFASTYPQDKLLLLNIVQESGMLTLRSLKYDCDVINIDGYADMQKAIEWIQLNGQRYDVIFVDSLSQWQKNLEKEIPEVKGKSGKEDGFAKWNTIAKYTKDTINAFKKLPFHTVFTCEVVRETNEENGVVYYMPSVAGKATRENLAYWFDEVYFFVKTQESAAGEIEYKILTADALKYPCKTRLRLPRVISNPKLDEFLKMAGFDHVDKTAQAKTLSTSQVVVEDPRIQVLRDLIKQKEANPTKVLAAFGATSIPAFPLDKIDEAIKILEELE